MHTLMFMLFFIYVIYVCVWGVCEDVSDIGVLMSIQAFLTDHGFIHRDLSTRTVLIGDRLNVKVSDPGTQHINTCTYCYTLHVCIAKNILEAEL